MPWGAAIAAAGAVAGGALSMSGSQSAASTEANAANNASRVQQEMFGTTQGNLKPFMSAGYDALSTLQGLMSPGGSDSSIIASHLPALRAAMAGEGHPLDPNWMPSADMINMWRKQDYPNGSPTGDAATAPLLKPFTAADFQSSPGYNFQMSQGVNAIDNSSAAKGFTGNTLKDLMTYGQGLANQDWWNAYNAYVGRQKQTYDFLSGMAGNGQNAAANLGSIGANVGGQIGSNIVGAGNASAAGTIGATNAATGAINGATQNYLLYQLMQQNQPGGVTSVTSMGGSPAY